MKRLRVIVLCHEDLVPPDSLRGAPDEDILRWRTEFDVVQSLKALGHETQVLGVSDDMMPLRRLVEGWRPHVVFNLLSELRDVGAYEVHVASYLELLGVPYTGCNSRGLMLSRDKALAKKIFRYHRIPTPDFAVFRRQAKFRLPQRLAFPLIVKSIEEDASLGVSQASIVHDPDALAERVDFVHRRVKTGAIVEEYIEGRELTIGVLGNQRLQTFPVWEMHFRKLPEGSAPIATAHAKWNVAYQKKVGVRTARARVDEAIAARIAALARRAYRALEMSGFGRMDVRLTRGGRIYFIEANPNPDLADDEDFALAAEAAGIEYDAVIQRILNLGRRYRPPWAG